ncbi:DUF2269 family protein [Thalassospira sp.]|uniref:DUF2269 family protein n=1 Tax=Thalassospira sp. TaxID=1912094 RepID=UPI0027327B48|nr:DUF2269 family protein [Thalassospira sp.]MDP2696826.1 DUF2269 family protein [Thalassospira sp.]
MDFATLKFVHLLGVVLFMGNIVVTALWKSLADRTGNPAIIAHACRLVVVTDLAFTASGSLLLVIGGMGMLHLGGIDLATRPDLQAGIMLFVVAGVIWLVGLIPVQRRMARQSRDSLAQGHAELPASYRRDARRWNSLGIIATVLPLASLWYMIVR